MKKRNNITILYLTNFFGNLSFNAVIWMLYLQEAGISLFQVTILQSILNFGMLILEIPTGIFADRQGRKLSLILGNIFLALQAIILLFYPGNYILLIFAFLIAGFGFALKSGTDDSILYESIEETGQKDKTTKILGKYNAIGNWALILGMIFGGLLGYFSGKFVYIAVIIARLFTLLFSFFLSEEKLENSNTEEDNHFKDFFIILKEQKKNIPIFTSFALIITFISLYYLFAQETFAEVELPIFLIGVVFAISHFFEGLAGIMAHKIEQRIKEFKLFRIVLIILGILFAGLLFKDVILFPLIFVLINFLFGIIDPIITRVINEKFISKHRTALNSTFNFLSSFMMLLMGPMLGFFAVATNRGLSFFISITSMITIIIILIFYKKRYHNSDKEI